MEVLARLGFSGKKAFRALLIGIGFLGYYTATTVVVHCHYSSGCIGVVFS